MKKILTLIVVYDNQKILLGMKKRGFGAGRWNGFGGKVHDGETIEQAAKRELLEEAGIVAIDLKDRGVLTFTFQNNTDELVSHLFSTNSFVGEIVETEEMKPQWFTHKEIPYSEMWTDDQYWLPLFLEGKNIQGKIEFDNPDVQTILNKSITAEYV